MPFDRILEQESIAEPERHPRGLVGDDRPMEAIITALAKAEANPATAMVESRGHFAHACPRR